MTLETARKGLGFYYDRNTSGAEYRVSITFFGGEPMLEVELMEAVVAMARERRPNVFKRPAFTATTNGTIATPAVEKVVRDANMALLVSLDGTADQNAHRPFESGRSSYAAVARNLPKLVSWAPVTVVRMTYHPDALDLVGNVRHVLDLGAPIVALCPVDESPWHLHQERLEAAFEALADWFISEARAGRSVPLEITHMLLRQWHYVQQGGQRPSRPCGVGFSILAIDTDGNILPCHRFIGRTADFLGHVDRPVMSPERWKYAHLSSSTILGCDTCSARDLCGGGCRAVVVHEGGNLDTGTSPGYCLTTRAHARAVRTIYTTLMAENSSVLNDILGTPSRPDGAALIDMFMQ